MHGLPPRTLEAGVGKPVVLLHGLMGSACQWQQTVDRFAGRYHLFAPELPFLELVNGSDGVIGGFALYVKHLMQSKGIERAILGGNSLGGHIALEMAISFPDAVEGLILTGSSGLMERGFDRDVPIHPSRDYIRGKIREIFFEETFVTEELLDRGVGLVADRARLIKVVRIARSARRDNLGPRLSRIDCPTLLAWGRDDRITPPEAALDLQARIRGAELHFIDRCGHVPMIEQPLEFNRLVERFLLANFPDAEASMRRTMYVNAFSGHADVRQNQNETDPADLSRSCQGPAEHIGGPSPNGQRYRVGANT
jgi:pimeloyl-ACP methyl ester carboxylesterase